MNVGALLQSYSLQLKINEIESSFTLSYTKYNVIKSLTNE